MKPILPPNPGYQLFPSQVDKVIGRSILLLGLFLVCVLGGCDTGQTSEEAFSTPQAQQPPSPPLRDTVTDKTEPQGPLHLIPDAPAIVAFGDSLTAGRGITQDQSYPAQLQERLREAGYQYRVINAGVNGDTTAGGLRRVEWVLKSKPLIVIIELGANDGLRGHRLEETTSNLEKIIQRFQEAGITVILAGMKIPPNYGLEYTGRFSEMYQTLAQRYQVALIPFFLEGVAAIPSLNQADGIHPTAHGYTKVVDNVMPVLEPILKEIRGAR